MTLLFDSKTWDNIVIVPPKPDVSLSQHDDFSYLHLFHYDQHDKAEVTHDKRGSVSTTKTTSISSIGSSSSSSSSGDDCFTFDTTAVDNNNDDDKEEMKVKTDEVPSADAVSHISHITRDPRNGAFTFSVNSEYDLLLHIQRSLDQAYRSSGNLSDVATAEVIMSGIDDYCWKKQWMYHVGKDKSQFISKFLERSIDDFVRRNHEEKTNKTYVCVELGTYCGYSALVLACTLRRAVMKHGSEVFDFHIYTTEISSKLLNVAMSVFRLSKMEHHVTAILMEEGASISSTLNKFLPKDSNGIDFLFLDHAKSLYLPDLMDLESARLLRQHSYVSADNVIFNRLDNYRNHMKKWVKQGVAETALEEMNLEYSNNLKDGIEMTIYLKDLP